MVHTGNIWYVFIYAYDKRNSLILPVWTHTVAHCRQTEVRCESAKESDEKKRERERELSRNRMEKWDGVNRTQTVREKKESVKDVTLETENETLFTVQE